MHMRLVLLPLIALIGACEAAVPATEQKPRGIAQFEGDPRLGEVTDRICFTSSIDGFQNTTRDTVVFNNGRRDYIVEVFGSCLPLRDAQQIAFVDRAGCASKGDRLVVSEDIVGTGHRDDFNRTQTCTIRSIYTWDSKAEAPHKTTG